MRKETTVDGVLIVDYSEERICFICKSDKIVSQAKGSFCHLFITIASLAEEETLINLISN